MLEWLKNILGEDYTDEVDAKVSAEIGKNFVTKADFNQVNTAKKKARRISSPFCFGSGYAVFLLRKAIAKPAMPKRSEPTARMLQNPASAAVVGGETVPAATVKDVVASPLAERSVSVCLPSVSVAR